MKRGFLKSTKGSKALDTGKAADKKQEVLATKCSYGVVEQAGRPEGYKAAPTQVREFSGHNLAYNDDQYIGTTQPSQFMDATLEDEPDGWSQCYISGFTKRLILSTPGFPMPIPRQPKVAHKIVDIPGKGIGVVATRDIQAGDLIFAERPILILPRVMSIPIQVPEHFTDEQVRQAIMYEWEKQVIEPLFARCLPEVKEAYLSLHNSHLQDGSGPLTGIGRTNGFFIDLKNKTDDPNLTYSATVKDGSRFNHSCMPNVTHFWNTASFAIQFRAASDIKAGEELTLSYCTLEDPAVERQKSLEPYGFQCTCPACENRALSDIRRTNYSKRMPAVFEFPLWVSDPKLPEDHVRKSCLEQLKVCEEEKLHTECLPTQAYLELVMQSYAVMADEENTLKYGKMLGQQILANTGDDTELKQYSSIQFHRKEPSWGYRKDFDPRRPPMLRLKYFGKMCGMDPDDKKLKVMAFPV